MTYSMTTPENHSPIWVPKAFHIMVQALDRAHRDLARLEVGASLENKETPYTHGPRCVEEAYHIVCISRRWLYEWVEENDYDNEPEHLTAVKFD